jgi:hypothetical protein
LIFQVARRLDAGAPAAPPLNHPIGVPLPHGVGGRSVGLAGRVEVPWTAAFDRIKTVSKPNPLEVWDLPLSEEQTPHVVEKPENRWDTMEPREASCGLPWQGIEIG